MTRMMFCFLAALTLHPQTSDFRSSIGSAALDAASTSTTCSCLSFEETNSISVSDAQVVRAPLVDGTRISSGFGMRMHPIFGYLAMHWGVDIAAAFDSPIRATADGVVEIAKLLEGYGNYVLVRHRGNCETGYAHASRFAAAIVPGAHVRKGQVIAYVGSTGISTGPHLHYEVLVKGRWVDPDCSCNDRRLRSGM
jgi:murein DD-endopeptidase MepM/ murein hydrolase activator NlpD